MRITVSQNDAETVIEYGYRVSGPTGLDTIVCRKAAGGKPSV
jgi:hypothetical protein